MEEKKPKSYVKYAIGEIVLVVIGILIAVQLNNWNEKRISSNNAREFITDLQKDLQTDTSVFGAEIRKIDRLIDYKKWILSLENFDSVPIEYLEGVPQIGYHNIKIITGTMIRMRNADVWNTKKYRSFFKSLNSYYTFNEPYLNNLNEWEKVGAEKEFSFWNEQGEFEVLYNTIDSVDLFQDSVVRRKKLNQLITSTKGRNYIKMSVNREAVMGRTYKGVYKIAKKLLGEIEEVTKNG